MYNYQLKRHPADFQVQEVANFISQPNNKNKYHYYLITKCGYTTFQAISLIEKHFLLPTNSVHHSGLKDEDAITSQYISVPKYFDLDSLEDFNRNHSDNKERYITIQYFGSGDNSLKVAKLLGNCFRIKVRNLSEQFACSLTAQSEHTLFYINYYGGQRFGLPNQIKNTHLIGKALINGNHDLALSELLKQTSETQASALKFQGPAEVFFSNLRQGQVAFYQNAYYSHIWNEEIFRYFEQASSIASISRVVDGIEYRFLQKEDDIFNLLKNQMFLENIRVVIENNSFQRVIYKRPSLIQLRVTVEQVEKDDDNPNMYAAELSFFLPSGGYATIAIPQYLEIVSAMDSSKEKEQCHAL